MEERRATEVRERPRYGVGYEFYDRQYRSKSWVVEIGGQAPEQHYLIENIDYSGNIRERYVSEGYIRVIEEVIG